MKGDFSRITFDPSKHFSRVLSQQGRVTLDADPNEQADILLHYIRTLARDLIGPSGGPTDQLGFQLTVNPAAAGKPANLSISAGRYYVDGILCENDSVCDYASQPNFTPPGDDVLLKQFQAAANQTLWLYLDVWEQHITCIESDRIREVALNGPDTSTRAKVVWQVKALSVDATNELFIKEPCTTPLTGLTAVSNAQLTARLDPGQQIADPCTIAPDALYRGPENQLYRVEIHRGSGAGQPTFKWSRDNGSVVARWIGTEGNDLLVANSRGFTAGTWVELCNDADELLGLPGVLVKLVKVEAGRLSVDVASVPSSAALVRPTDRGNTKVRRWDQTENDEITLDAGAVPIVEATAANPHWVDLEDGIQVQFVAGTSAPIYRGGDYWQIAARVATGDIEWPHDRTGTTTTWHPLPPQGVEHHFAPLGVLTITRDSSTPFKLDSCMCTFTPSTVCGPRPRRRGPP